MEYKVIIKNEGKLNETFENLSRGIKEELKELLFNHCYIFSKPDKMQLIIPQESILYIISK